MLPFYQRSEAERIALTAAAIRDRSTIVSRWSALQDDEAAGWTMRARAAADWIGDRRRGVLDLGCGTMLLERFIARSLAYYPSDVVARDERTIVCDLNTDPPPQVDADAVTCLGLIEYLHNPVQILRNLKYYGMAVVSYNIVDKTMPLSARRAHGWVNDYSIPQITGMFAEAGWALSAHIDLGGHQHLWAVQNNGLIDPSN